jgi:RND family efflux transporter MFP subunit
MQSNYRRVIRIGATVFALIAIATVVIGITSRANQFDNVKDWTAKQAIPTVRVGLPNVTSEMATMTLPGRLEAYARAPIYARVSGYLKSWKVDIGSSVKAGQLLGEIETPDLDQELLQARADLASAQANLSLAETTANRWKDMLTTQAISKQEVDERVGDFLSKQAIVKAQEANVNRILALKGFTKIVAPFDGSVTARNVDTGAYINAGNSNAVPLFEISDTRKLRLYVNVPQNYVSSVQVGTQAKFTVPEHQDNTYSATINSSSGAINVASGTTLVQLLVNNAAQELLPGGYASVVLDLPNHSTLLSVPASALIFDQAGLRVATVGQDNKVVLKTITIARDLGKTIEVNSGVEATERVIENPPDGISEGDLVNVAKPL